MNYGADIYIHGVKQEPLNDDTAITNLDEVNIIGARKVTQEEGFFSPEISPKTVTTPVCISASEPSTNTRGKESVIEPV